MIAGAVFFYAPRWLHQHVGRSVGGRMPEAPSVKGAEPGRRDGKPPVPRHLLADISEQVVIGQGKAAHLFSQLQSPLGIERKKQHFKGQQ